MLPPVTPKVHSPHASFSKASGSARQTSRSRFSAGFESSYIRGCGMQFPSGSFPFDDTETRGRRNCPGKLEPCGGEKRVEFRLGALTAAGGDQHVDIGGRSTAREVRLVDARRINALGDEQLALQRYRMMDTA